MTGGTAMPGRLADGEVSRAPQRAEAAADVLSNPRSDRVRAVRRLAARSARRWARRFVAEGPQAVREAVLAHAQAVGAGGPALVLELYVTPEAARRHSGILAAAAAVGLAARPAEESVLAAMADTVTPQGLLAVCTLVDVPLHRALESRPALVAVLAEVRDPGNAGTVIRAADAAGAGAVVLTGASVDVHNPKCVRASAGSLFHLPICAGTPLPEAVAAVRSAGATVLAADVAGTADLDDLLDAAAAGAPGAIAGPVAWVFGNEARGLPEGALALADAVVRVPVHGRAESLNLAAAATVCLYATARAQRRGAGCLAAGAGPAPAGRPGPGIPAREVQHPDASAERDLRGSSRWTAADPDRVARDATRGGRAPGTT